MDNDLLLNTFQLLLEKDRGHRKDLALSGPQKCAERQGLRSILNCFLICILIPL